MLTRKTDFISNAVSDVRPKSSNQKGHMSCLVGLWFNFFSNLARLLSGSEKYIYQHNLC